MYECDEKVGARRGEVGERRRKPGIFSMEIVENGENGNLSLSCEHID